ncbi:MAG: DNA gyrase inhibitor YacG, partial [Fimbriiglobus sp.]
RSPPMISPGKTTCPICGTPMPGNWADYPDYPFCSKRCRTIDLGRWLGEEYRVGGPPADPDASSEAE